MSLAMVYIRVFSWCYIFSVGFDKCMMSCIHHYNIIEHSLLSYKSSVLYYSSLSSHQFLAITGPFTFHSFSFPGCHIVGIIQYLAFQVYLFYLVVCILDFSMSSYGLISHLFLGLNNIPLSGCTTVCFSVHLLTVEFCSMLSMHIPYPHYAIILLVNDITLK